MSNFIPMVSSSPPPLEDTGGFDDWDDDDDFGTFTGANNNSDLTPFQSDDSCNVLKNQTSDSSELQFGNFANFETVSSSTENVTDTTIIPNNFDSKGKQLSLDLENSEKLKPVSATESESSINFVDKNGNEKEELELKDDNESENKNSIARNTTRDSGIFSTDISPSPKSDVKQNMQDEFIGSEEDLYDSQSEDSTSKDISETPDLNQMDNIVHRQISNSYISETDYNTVSPSAEDNKNNETDSLNQELSGCDSPLHDFTSGTNSEQSDNSENINSKCVTMVTDNVNDITHNDRVVDIKFKTSSSHNSLDNSLDGMTVESNLVQDDDSNKDTLINPPSNSNCDNLYNVCDSGISLTQSCKDSKSSVLADSSSSVKDSGIEISDSVIRNVDVEEKLDNDTENGSLPLTDKCPIENERNSYCLKQHVNTESSLCKNEIDSNDQESLGTENYEKLSKSSEESLDDFTDFQQSKENFNNQQSSETEREENVRKENIEILPDETVSLPSGSASTSQNGSSENLDNNSDAAKTSVEESHEDVESDLGVVKESSSGEICSNEKIFSGYNSDENLNLKIGEDDDDHDFDEFADFQTVTEFSASENVNKISAINNENSGEFSDKSEKENGDNDWGFHSASAVNDDGDGKWANFQEPVISQNATNDDNNDDDEFGDFGDFSGSGEFTAFTSKSQENFESANSTTKSEPNKGDPAIRTKIFSRQRKVSESVVDDVVDEMITESDSMVSDMSSHLNTIDSCLMSQLSVVNGSKAPSKGKTELWSKLKNLNSTTAIKYQWPDSDVNKKLFTTLKIDTQNILLGHRKQAVPIYASNLTMLEPTKGPIAPKPTIDQQLVDTDQSKAQQIQNLNMEIPPVQFDWTTSGLTNPLEENRKTLGLDFLVVQEAESTSRPTVLSGDQGPQEVKTSLQPLENILATLKVSTLKKTKQTENLGQEAAKIITSLPDLSFMQAKVLMFPLRQQNNN